MTQLRPTVTGTVTSYSALSGLPPGITIDIFTGIISGTPTTEAPAASYLIVARNAIGPTSFEIVFVIHEAPPSALNYGGPLTLKEGQPMTPLFPTVSGNVEVFAVIPELPVGLFIAFDTGEVRGTPLLAKPQATYTFSAANEGGSTTTQVSISVEPPDPPDFSFVSSINSVNDVVWSPDHQLLYLAIGSVARTHPNSVIAFDPGTGTIANSVFAGSEPWSLGISDDGTLLYVGLRGADEIRRFTLPALAPDLTILSDPGPRVAEPIFANQIEVAPGSPHTFAIQRLSIEGTATLDFRVFDDQVARPNAELLVADALSWGNDDSTLYGAHRMGFNTLLDTHSTSGPVVTLESTQIHLFFALFPDGIPFHDGLIYSDFEKVLDVANAQIVGRLPGARGHVAVDTASDRAFFAWVGEESRLSVSSFDIESFTGIGAATRIPIGTPVRHIVRWGQDGLALTNKAGLLITLSGPFVDPGFAGTPMHPIPVLSTGWQPVVPASNVLSTPANDIAWDAQRGVIYASVPANATQHPNTIAVIDPATGAATAHVPTLSNPGPLAISADGQYLYVGELDSFERFRLPGLIRDITVPLADGTPRSIVVAPGTPATIAISNSGVIRVYDDGVVRRDAALGNRVVWGEDSSELFILHSDDSSFRIVTYSVTGTGLTLTDQVSDKFSIFNPFAFGVDFSYSDGLLYGGTGVVYDPSTHGLVGTFALPLSPVLPMNAFERQLHLGVPVIDEVRNRAYFATFTTTASDTGQIGQILFEGFDTTTFTPIFRADPIGIGGAATRLLRIDPTTFAIRNGAGQVTIISSPEFAN